MAYFAKTSMGYFNVDAVAFITQQVGGAYRIRFTDGMTQVISKDDGDAVMQAIEGDMDRVLEDARNKAVEIFKAEQVELTENAKPKRKTQKKTA